MDVPIHPVAGKCGDDDPCPKTHITDQEAYFQGRLVTDPTILTKTKPGPDEAVVAQPLDMLFDAARQAGQRLRSGEPQAGNLFDTFTDTVFRLETHQVYTVDVEAERLSAFLEGRPLPERSVRNPWLRRIALTTMEGKEWQRARIVEYPLTDYTRFELVSYTENTIAGMITRIAERDAHPGLAELREDFWLFDADTDHAVVRWMHYDEQGHYLGTEATTDPAVIARCRQQRDLVWANSIPLNEFVATKA